jgi:hypothetical protein
MAEPLVVRLWKKRSSWRRVVQIGILATPSWIPSVRFWTTLSMWCSSWAETCSNGGNCSRLCLTNGMLYWYMRKRRSFELHCKSIRRTMLPMSLAGPRPGRCSTLTIRRNMTWSSLGMRELKSTESSSSSFDVSAAPESCFSAWRSLEITRSSSGATASAPKKWVHAAEGAPSACPSTTVCEKTRLGKSSGGPSKRPSPDTFAVVGLMENPRSTRRAARCGARRRRRS